MGTTVPDALANLRTALAARPGLAGVGVHLYDGAWTEPALLVLTQLTAPQSWVSMGTPGREEQVTLTGYVFAELPGAGDTAAATAQARAGAILDELVAQLDTDPDLGGAVPAGMSAPLLTQATWRTVAGDVEGASRVGVQIDWTATWTADLS